MAYTIYLHLVSCVEHSHLVEIKVHAHLQFYVLLAPQRVPEEDNHVYICEALARM